MRFFITALLICALSSCSSAGRNPSSVSPADLQTTERDGQFEALMASLNLESPDYELKFKDTGTSLGMKIKRGKDKVGKWAPQNEATDVEAQVVSYRLGRFLGMSELVIPSAYHTIKGRSFSEFHAMVAGSHERNRIRLMNQSAILAAMAKRTDGLDGVFMAPVENFEVVGLANSSGSSINSSHPMAAFIRANGPAPSASKAVTLGGPKDEHGELHKNGELALARELSKVMVLDLLAGQYDRWSGGNMEATYDGSGLLHFIARDNGGAELAGTFHVAGYLAIVSRFDRHQIAQVARLSNELAANPAEVAALLGLRESRAKFLAARANALLTHVKNMAAKFGEERIYFPD